jgi:hypothetical protein
LQSPRPSYAGRQVHFEKEIQDMNSRGIAVGASVIALALAGAGPSAAAGLGDVAPTVSIETGVGAQATAQLGGVKANPNLDTSQRTDSHSGTGARSLSERQSVQLGGSARLSPSIARRGTLTEQAKTRVDTRLKGDHAKGSSRFSARADVRGPKSTRVKTRAHGRSSAALSQRKGLRGLGGVRLAPKSKGALLPFRDVGREVGNPLQLQLAGWLLVLTAGICLGVARMARRRGHRFN